MTTSEQKAREIWDKHELVGEADYNRKFIEALLSDFAKAIDAEREACAKIAIAVAAKSESGIGVNPEHRSCLEIAAAIRSRETDNE